MKLTAISLVRDEADIIEAWARHNLEMVDRLYVVDDGSTDATPDILRRLAAEGLDVRIVDDGVHASLVQSRRIRALMAHAVSDDSWDYVFPIDADEFIAAESRAVLEEDLAALPAPHVGGLCPLHYRSSPEDDAADLDPLSRLKNVVVHEPYPFKVAIPRHLAEHPETGIQDGYHKITQWQNVIPSPILPRVPLAHFPMRSREQLVAKCVIGYMRWRARDDFRETFATTMMEAARILREEKTLELEHFERFEATYAPYSGNATRFRPFTERRGRVAYPELSATYPYRRILAAAEGLIDGARTAAQENRALKHQLEMRRGGGLSHFVAKTRRSLMKRLTRRG